MMERPQARRAGLIVQELLDELLIYDEQRHRAFCLNPTAAFVWKQADGRRTIATLSRDVERAFGVPEGEGEALVRLALNRLARARLLENGQPFLNDKWSPSRRELIRRIGRWGLSASLAFLLPTVKALVAPTAAQTATTITPQDCSRYSPPRCPRLRCVGPTGTDLGPCVRWRGLCICADLIP